MFNFFVGKSFTFNSGTSRGYASSPHAHRNFCSIQPQKSEDSEAHHEESIVIEQERRYKLYFIHLRLNYL